MKRRTSDPWRVRLIALERAASALEASAKLAKTLDEETACSEAAFAVRARMRLSMAAVEENFIYDEQKSTEPASEPSRSPVHRVSTAGYADEVSAKGDSRHAFLDKLDELLVVQSVERNLLRTWLVRAASIVVRFDSEYLHGIKRLEFLDDCQAFVREFTAASILPTEAQVARASPAVPEPTPAKAPETVGERWERGTPHDPRSIHVMKSIAAIDVEQCSDSFCWKFGGDGDNGETLMYLLDVHFEREDARRGAPGAPA